MTPDVLTLVDKINDGTMTPEQAVEQYQLGPNVQRASDINIDNLSFTPLDTGFPTLDSQMVFKKGVGELIVVAARPSMGKSAFMFQIAAHVSSYGHVLMFSLEMNKRGVMRRLLAQRLGKPIKNLHLVPSKDKDAVLASLDRLYVDDRESLDITDLKSTAYSVNRKYKLDLIVVDYLQIVKSSGGYDRHNVVGDIALELRNMARELGVPVLTGAQLNRECERRGRQPGKNFGDYMPMKSDLQESAKVENHVDGLIFLNRQEVYEPGKRKGRCDVKIAKNREGEANRVMDFQFSGELTKFIDDGGDGDDL